MKIVTYMGFYIKCLDQPDGIPMFMHVADRNEASRLIDHVAVNLACAIKGRVENV